MRLLPEWRRIRKVRYRDFAQIFFEPTYRNWIGIGEGKPTEGKFPNQKEPWSAELAGWRNTLSALNYLGPLSSFSEEENQLEAHGFPFYYDKPHENKLFPSKKMYPRGDYLISSVNYANGKDRFNAVNSRFVLGGLIVPEIQRSKRVKIVSRIIFRVATSLYR